MYGPLELNDMRCLKCSPLLTKLYIFFNNAVNDFKKYDSTEIRGIWIFQAPNPLLHVRLDKEMKDYRQTFPALIRKCQSQIILY